MSETFESGATEQFAERLLLLDDSLACVATIHLCVEYWINRIVNEKCSLANEILGDAGSHSFQVKLGILWNTGLLPEPLWRLRFSFGSRTMNKRIFAAAALDLLRRELLRAAGGGGKERDGLT